jgi:hypothetical protein
VRGWELERRSDEFCCSGLATAQKDCRTPCVQYRSPLGAESSERSEIQRPACTVRHALSGVCSGVQPADLAGQLRVRCTHASSGEQPGAEQLKNAAARPGPEEKGVWPRREHASCRCCQGSWAAGCVQAPPPRSLTTGQRSNDRTPTGFTTASESRRLAGHGQRPAASPMYGGISYQ